MDKKSWIKRRIVEIGGHVLWVLSGLLVLLIKETIDDTERALLFLLICFGVLAVLSIVRAVLYYSLEEEDRPDCSSERVGIWQWKGLFDYEKYRELREAHREWSREMLRFALHPVTMTIFFSILFLVVLAAVRI